MAPSDVFIRRMSISHRSLTYYLLISRIYKPTGRSVAIKCISLPTHHPHNANDKSGDKEGVASLATLRTEVNALAAGASHPNIVRYWHGLLWRNELWVVMEYCALGSLRSILDSPKPTTTRGVYGDNNVTGLQEDIVWTVAEKVAAALCHLHAAGIVHRDIKAANILITAEHEVKLADFGVAFINSSISNTKKAGIAGSPHWMPPEIIKHQSTADPRSTGSDEQDCSPAADIWSFGITLIELLRGMPPYADLPPFEALRRIASTVPPTCEECSERMQKVLRACLNDEPKKRLTAMQLMEIVKAESSVAQQRRERGWMTFCRQAALLPKPEESRNEQDEDERQTLVSEWTFGATISSNFTLKTSLTDDVHPLAASALTTTNPSDAASSEGGGVLPEQQTSAPSFLLNSPTVATNITVVAGDASPLLMSPFISKLGSSVEHKNAHDGGGIRRLLQRASTTNTATDGDRRTRLAELVNRKKACSPHIVIFSTPQSPASTPPLAAKNKDLLTTTALMTQRKQTEEQRLESEKLDRILYDEFLQSQHAAT